MKLNQVIALVQGRKARATKTLTDAYRWKDEMLKGISRTYKPNDEDGEKLPSENKVVPLHAETVIKGVTSRLTDLYNTVITQETANQEARADIIIDGGILLAGVPITVLLFFEKQLIDLLTFTKSIPVLPVDKTWKWEQQKGCWVTDPEITTRTTKLPKVIVKYNATKEHPAQTEMYSEDKITGHWSTIHMSGAVPKTKKDDIINRIEKMQDAVKQAREKANGLDVPSMSQAGEIFIDHIFNG